MSGQRETVVICMLDRFVGHLRGVKLGEATIETRISVNYLEIIYRDDFDLIVRGRCS